MNTFFLKNTQPQQPVSFHAHPRNLTGKQFLLFGQISGSTRDEQNLVLCSYSIDCDGNTLVSTRFNVRNIFIFLFMFYIGTWTDVFFFSWLFLQIFINLCLKRVEKNLQDNLIQKKMEHCRILSPLIDFIFLKLQQDLVSILFQDGLFSLFMSPHSSQHSIHYIVDVKLNMLLNSLVGEGQSYFRLQSRSSDGLIENRRQSFPTVEGMISNARTLNLKGSGVGRFCTSQ